MFPIIIWISNTKPDFGTLIIPYINTAVRTPTTSICITSTENYITEPEEDLNFYRFFFSLSLSRNRKRMGTKESVKQKTPINTCLWNWLRQHKAVNWEEWLRFLSVLPNSTIAVTAIDKRIYQLDGASMNYRAFQLGSIHLCCCGGNKIWPIEKFL